MRMSDFVVRDAIIPQLNAVTKEGVIREMVEGLKLAGQFRGTDLEDVVAPSSNENCLGRQVLVEELPSLTPNILAWKNSSEQSACRATESRLTASMANRFTYSFS